MSRAEKFIQDCTRNCSNELCAVEDRFGKKVISYHEWLTPDQAKKAVEIARKEIAEKDLELTWEDLATIKKLGDDFVKHNQTPMSDEKFYKEVLKRFKDYKERKG